MLFDPNAGWTIEDIILHQWEHEWTAERKAQIEQLAAQLGCSWWEVVMECLEILCDEWEDPIARQRLEAKWERQARPFGIDPRLRQEP